LPTQRGNAEQQEIASKLVVLLVFLRQPAIHSKLQATENKRTEARPYQFDCEIWQTLMVTIDEKEMRKAIEPETPKKSCERSKKQM
jgi:hypothetical protein